MVPEIGGPRIAILRSDDAHHHYLSALLQRRFDVVTDIVEPGAAQRRRLWTRRQYKNFVYWHYHRLRRSVLGLNAYRQRYFADLPAVPAERRTPALTVDWINDATTLAELERANADLAIVICTSILRRETIAAAGDLVINVHGGHLPEYRGNHCFFFALYEGRFDKVGATIHFIDAGIDTGDIIEVIRPPMYSDDNAERLYSRADKLAMHRLADLLDDYAAGGDFERRPQTLPGRLYLTRDRKPRHDIVFWLRRKTGRLTLPDRPGSAVPASPRDPRSTPTVHAVVGSDGS